MVRIAFFTKRSVFFVLLVSNAINPLLAVEPKICSIVTNKQQESNMVLDIKNMLVERGLELDAAEAKASKLFNNSEYKADTLMRLCNTPELCISKDVLNNTLAKYALYEKELDFSSYSSLVALVQSVSAQPLNKQQFEAIEKIADLHIA